MAECFNKRGRYPTRAAAKKAGVKHVWYCQSCKAYHPPNPDRPLRQAFKNNRMRARKRGVVDTLTYMEMMETFNEYGFMCVHCGFDLRSQIRNPLSENHPRKLTVEHIVPMGEGGGNTKDNVAPACLKCNVPQPTEKTKELAMTI